MVHPVHSPFHDTWYVVIDSFRFVSVALSFVVMVLTGWSASRLIGRPRSRIAIPLHVVVLCFAVSAAFTELGRLGHVLTWRLPVHLVGLIAAIPGMYFFGSNSEITPTVGVFTPLLRRLEQVEVRVMRTSATVDRIEKILKEK